MQKSIGKPKKTQKTNFWWNLRTAHVWPSVCAPLGALRNWFFWFFLVFQCFFAYCQFDAMVYLGNLGFPMLFCMLSKDALTEAVSGTLRRRNHGGPTHSKGLLHRLLLCLDEPLPCTKQHGRETEGCVIQSIHFRHPVAADYYLLLAYQNGCHYFGVDNW